MKRCFMERRFWVSRFKELVIKYRHAWVFLYAFIYMPWFLYLERTVTSGYHIIHVAIDDYIPFCEYFIIPYLMWFAYIAIAFLYFFFTNKSDFYKFSAFLFTGMTLFLIISTIYPNGLALRPTHFVRDNFCVDLVKTLYAADTSTNVLPSLHVFNSIGVFIAVTHSKALQKHKGILWSSGILSTLIIMATVFLKQHSIIDVFAGFVMAAFIYQLVYARDVNKSYQLSHQPS